MLLYSGHETFNRRFKQQIWAVACTDKVSSSVEEGCPLCRSFADFTVDGSIL